MDPIDIEGQLEKLIANWENEVVEFKRDLDQNIVKKLGKYFSALSNEARLRNVDPAWLVIGVDNNERKVVGTSFREGQGSLDQLKNDVSNGTSTKSTFRNIYELEHSSGRVVIFEIPPAPVGLPVSWNGHHYARNGESIGALSADKLDQLRRERLHEDWSAQVIPEASINDLHPEALQVARTNFAQKTSERVSKEEITLWSDTEFLDKARLTINGQITRTAILLLGKPEASHFLAPLSAEITWRLIGEDRVYEHFPIPFLMATTQVYRRIRNHKIYLHRPNTLLQLEVEKYDQAGILEAIHNCVAHADYTFNARIVVEEHHDRLVLRNMGSFKEGSPEDYILHQRTPMTYRNTFLVAAMVNLNMIDALGSGISRITSSQRSRYLPLPEYDLTQADQVSLTIYGEVIDTNFSQMLMAETDLPLDLVLALDRVQKKHPIDADMIKRLRRFKLIEGRSPKLKVSSAVATATGTQGAYVRSKLQSDMHYQQLIIAYIDGFGAATKQDITTLLWESLDSQMSDEQKANKISNLLSKMRREGVIENLGTRSHPEWQRVK